jgi:alkylation response protein AidB-like acyl-CoA dehydrogenase
MWPTVSTRTRPLVAVRRRIGARAFHYKAPLREMRFVAEEVHDFQGHFQTLQALDGAAADKETVDSLLETMGSFCETEVWPLSETADLEGCKVIDSTTVRTPTGFKKAYDEYIAGGWQGMGYPEAYGGANLPWSLTIMQSEMLQTASMPFSMFPGLGKGAINTIMLHASEELKDRYLPPMVEGRWCGTMCLTEPQCGSDLAQVKTRAEPQEDGSYRVTGTKIFISAGDHDLTENIVHTVLARTPDAPEGIKGISLFLVPKISVDDNGELGELNNVHVDRIEDKMGCHGSPTCQMNFDGGTPHTARLFGPDRPSTPHPDPSLPHPLTHPLLHSAPPSPTAACRAARGFLIGTLHKGLNHMFTFMNTARIGTAMQGVTAAELALQGSTWYAKERLAMRSLSGVKNPDGPADPIIVHPDVRKNLLIQKCVVEGGRSMVYECAKLADAMGDAQACGDTKREAGADDRMGLFTPILKGFLTEMGLEAASLGVQVYGGHGYIRQNKMEQILRDVRIGTIWEGTTGIQALDLLGRKILLQKLKPINRHCAEVRGYAWSTALSAPTAAVRSHALALYTHAAEWQYLAVRIAMRAGKDRDALGAASVDFLMYSGYVECARHWLLMEVAAEKATPNGEEEFYDSKRKAAAFYFEHMLPRTRSLAATMLAPTETLMGLKQDQFCPHVSD